MLHVHTYSTYCHIYILYIGYMGPYNLQYLHTYIHIYTHIGYMSAYNVHITNIYPYTIHTHTKNENIPKIYIHKYITYIHIHTFIHVHTYHHTHIHWIYAYILRTYYKHTSLYEPYKY